MDIALAKRRENIAEYILYLWQIEDLEYGEKTENHGK